MLWFVVAVAVLGQARGENLPSCVNTNCGSKDCRIIQRCWGKDCQVGTTCLAPQDVPMGAAPGACLYDSPLLQSVDGGVLSEIQCSAAAIDQQCPVGTTCQDSGVCCTGAPKNEWACPSKPSQYYQARGDCKTFCRHDQECPGFQRCCDTGVGCSACMDTVPLANCETHSCSLGYHCVMSENDCLEYPCFASPTCIMDKVGECPALDQQVACTDQCQVDSHCLGDKKCCSAGGCNVCVSPGFTPISSSSTSSSATPTPNFSDFGGLDGSGGSGSSSGTGFGEFGGSASSSSSSSSSSSFQLPTTTPSSGFPDMSGFLSGGGGSSSSGSGSTGSMTASGDSGGTMQGGFGDFTGLSSSSSSSSSSSPSISLSGSGSGSTSTGTTNPFSSMLDAMKTLQSVQSGGGTSSTAMMDALKNLQSGTMSGAGTSTMMSKLLSQMSSGSSGVGSTSPFNNMLSNLNSLNGGSSGSTLSLNPLSSLSGLGGGSGGSGGGLDPILSGNTLQSIGGGGLGSIGGGGGGTGSGGGLSPSGLSPKLPMLGGRNTNRSPRRRNNMFNCPMCMMAMVMAS
ncbi:uncharacterized protein LOC143298231 [Babylonia areolata]|uniref:uncharacterized protein LOC143298231 n=1 Tax=Babylonia areolata TaxID=304850 RepID=UPI003FD220DD